MRGCWARPRTAAPHRYRNLVRVEVARRLLARGIPAAALATQVALADQAHLSRVFKSVTGVSPVGYARG